MATRVMPPADSALHHLQESRHGQPSVIAGDGQTLQGVLVVSPRLLSEEVVKLGWTGVDQSPICT